jgi:hypothetical protein
VLFQLPLQSLAPTPDSRRVDVRRPAVKMIAESLSQHDEKNVVPNPLSGIKGKKKKSIVYNGLRNESKYGLNTK